MDIPLDKMKSILIFLGPLLIPFLIIKYYFRSKHISLKDKVVLITGASSGLGEACGYVFHKLGCKVILCARREEELLRVQSNMISMGGLHNPKICVLDLGDLESIPSITGEAVSLFGRIDILINNGGMSYRGSILETDIKVHERIMKVNYFGHIVLTKAILPSMIENGYGHIVGISSVQGKLSIANRSAYSASKHACQAFYDCLRLEHGGKNIGVSVLSPGYINTNLSLNALTANGSVYDKMDATTASGMTTDYVANEVVKLIVHNIEEKLLCPFTHKIAVWLRHTFPTLIFFLLKRRAKK